jgi:hypothetical protein
MRRKETGKIRKKSDNVWVTIMTVNVYRKIKHRVRLLTPVCICCKLPILYALYRPHTVNRSSHLCIFSHLCNSPFIFIAAVQCRVGSRLDLGAQQYVQCTCCTYVYCTPRQVGALTTQLRLTLINYASHRSNASFHKGPYVRHVQMIVVQMNVWGITIC